MEVKKEKDSRWVIFNDEVWCYCPTKEKAEKILFALTVAQSTELKPEKQAKENNNEQ